MALSNGEQGNLTCDETSKLDKIICEGSGHGKQEDHGPPILDFLP